MRRLRRQRPGAQWFVTARCARAQYRLRPDAERTQVVTYCLGAALERFPGIRLHAAVAMSNHLHLVVTDRSGELADFMCYLLGPLAKAMNQLDSVRGQFFERRYSATEIVDDDALLDRVAYTVTNPAAANLVGTVEGWGGLCLWQSGTLTVEGSRFRKQAYTRALQAGADKQPEREAFTSRVRVNVEVIEIAGRDVTSELKAAVDQRLKSLATGRSGSRVLGMRKVLAQSVFDTPNRPKRSPLPLCHASTADAWRAFRDGWRRFTGAYRMASERFRGGVLSAPFPEHAFRPPTPLLA